MPVGEYLATHVPLTVAKDVETTHRLPSALGKMRVGSDARTGAGSACGGATTGYSFAVAAATGLVPLKGSCQSLAVLRSAPHRPLGVETRRIAWSFGVA